VLIDPMAGHPISPIPVELASQHLGWEALSGMGVGCTRLEDIVGDRVVPMAGCKGIVGLDIVRLDIAAPDIVGPDIVGSDIVGPNIVGPDIVGQDGKGYLKAFLDRRCRSASLGDGHGPPCCSQCWPQCLLECGLPGDPRGGVGEVVPWASVVVRAGP
jgi:hypothetical protein